MQLFNIPPTGGFPYLPPYVIYVKTGELVITFLFPTGYLPFFGFYPRQWADHFRGYSLTNVT